MNQIFEDVQLAEMRSESRGGRKIPKAVDYGTLTISEESARFEGEKYRREWKFENATGHVRADDYLMIEVSNRQATSGIIAEPEVLARALTALVSIPVNGTLAAETAYPFKSVGTDGEEDEDWWEDLLEFVREDALRATLIICALIFVGYLLVANVQSRLFNNTHVPVASTSGPTISEPSEQELAAQKEREELAQREKEEAEAAAKEREETIVSAVEKDADYALLELEPQIPLENFTFAGTYKGKVRVDWMYSISSDGSQEEYDISKWPKPAREMTITPTCEKSIQFGGPCTIKHGTYSLFRLADMEQSEAEIIEDKVEGSSLAWETPYETNPRNADDPFSLEGTVRVKDACVDEDGNPVGETYSDIEARLSFEDLEQIGEKFQFNKIRIDYFDDASETISGLGCLESSYRGTAVLERAND